MATIKTLWGVIASHMGACHVSEVQTQEAKNMISSVSYLEREIKS